MRASGKDERSRLASAVGVAVALVGVLHLVAWLAGLLRERGFNAMETNAALCLLLSGLALFLISSTRSDRTLLRRIADVSATVVLVIAGLTLVENLFAWDLGVDHLLAAEAPGVLAVADPNRMGALSSLCFFLAGCALLLLGRDRPGSIRAGQIIALTMCLIALVPSLGFLYEARHLFTVARLTITAWPTAASLLGLGAGLLLARRREGLIAQVTAHDAGGASIRRLLIPAILLPIGLIWVRLLSERRGLIDGPTGRALLALSLITVLAWLVYRSGQQTSRSAAILAARAEELRLAGEALRRQNAVLAGMNRIFQEAITCETEEQLGRTCLSVAEEVTGSQFGFIGQINQSGTLDGIAVSNPGWEASRMSEPGQQLPVNIPIMGIYGRVLNDGKSFFTNDPVSHPDSTGIPNGHPPIESLLGVPLKHDGKTIGLVAVANQVDGYSHDDQAALEALAGPIVQVLMRRRAEQRLRDRENELQVTINAAPALISYIDADYRYRRVNRSYERWFGVKAEDVQGRHVREVLGDAAWETVKPYMERALAGEIVTYERELPYQGGGPRWVHVTYAPDHDQSGRLSGFVAHVVDMSGIKQAEWKLTELNETLERRVTERTAVSEERAAQLRLLAEQLVQAEQRERQRISHILHEHFQQLLAAAKFSLNIVRRQLDNREQLQSLEHTDQVLGEAIRTSRSLAVELSPPALTYGGLLPGLRWLCDWVYEKHGLLVEIRAEPDDLTIPVDDVQTFLFAAVKELLFNIVKHASVDHAHVELARQGDGRLRVSVVDEGVGFDPDKRRLFGGLFSIQERVGFLGGQVEISSKRGAGTRVALLLPSGAGGHPGKRQAASSVRTP